MGRALRHRSNEGSHYQNSLERERERDTERGIGRGIRKDNIHSEGRREGGREQKHRRTCMYTHQHAHPSQLYNCETLQYIHCSRSFRGESRRLVGVPTLQVLQDDQTRLERGGGGGTEAEQREE